MARSTGKQHRTRICKRCGQVYTHTNRMERRHGRIDQPDLPGARRTEATWGGGWDALEHWWFNTHTLACARKQEVK